jgi:hypothetical protein
VISHRLCRRCNLIYYVMLINCAVQGPSRRGIQVKDLEPTAMNGTLITDLIDMVQKRMGIDLESLGANPAGNLVSREHLCNRALRA